MSTNAASGKVERIAEGKNLLENILLLEPLTWQTSQEVFRDWQAGAKVIGVNTANLGIYRLIDGEPVFDLLPREGNLFLDDRFRQRVYDGIISQDFFVLPEDMLEHVMSAINTGKAVEVPYSGLNLITEGCNPNYGYVKVSKGNTPAEETLISGVYGVKNPGHGKRVYLLRPNVVKKALKKNPQGAVARACYFSGSQDFDAIGRGIGSISSAVRGVRLVEVAGGDARKKYDAAYNLIIQQSDMLRPQQAAGLANVVAAYLSKQKQ